MRYFIWLAMVICSGCTAPVADDPQIPPTEPDEVIQEPAAPDIVSTTLDLAALDTTFLNAVDDASGELDQPLEHYFVNASDSGSLLWQGEVFHSEDDWIVLLQPVQGGAETAMRFELSGSTQTLDALMPQIGEILPQAEQISAEPDAAITFVRATLSGETWTFSVSVDHPDTGWEDYTDGWHVETPDGEILTTRILLHPHVDERPFTRSSSGFAIPEGVTEVYVRSHDLISGYGTDTVAIPIAEAGSGELYKVIR